MQGVNPATGRGYRWMGDVACTACGDAAYYKGDKLCKPCGARFKALGFVIGPLQFIEYVRPRKGRKRSSGNCEHCGTWRYSLHRDHRVPKFMGGSDEESNIQWLCANCHEDKTRDDLTGRHMPQWSSEAISARQRGRKHSPEWVANIKKGVTESCTTDDFRARMRYIAFNREKVECCVCGKQSPPGGMASHQRATGHQGTRRLGEVHS